MLLIAQTPHKHRRRTHLFALLRLVNDVANRSSYLPTRCRSIAARCRTTRGHLLNERNRLIALQAMIRNSSSSYGKSWRVNEPNALERCVVARLLPLLLGRLLIRVTSQPLVAARAQPRPRDSHEAHRGAAAATEAARATATRPDTAQPHRGGLSVSHLPGAARVPGDL